ncbi:MAG: oligosaccharide flippase family protein [Methanobacteriota archaeon]
MSGRPGRMLSNAGYVVAASLASKAIGALIVVALARYLGDGLFGTYSFAFSLAAVFAIFADFGLDALAIREVARRPEDGTSFGQLLTLRLAITGAVFPALAAAAFLLTEDLFAAGLVLIAGGVSMLDTASGIFYAFFRGVQRMGAEAYTQIAWRVAQAACVGAAIFLGLGIEGAMLAMLAASVVRLVASWGYCLRLGGKPAVGGSLKPWLKAAAPFAAFEFVLSFYIAVPTLALYWLSGSEQTGWFSAAYRAVGFVLIVPLALEAALYPVLAGMGAEEKRMRAAYLAGLRFVLFITVTGAILTFALAKPLTALLFGEGYDPVPLMALSAMMPLAAANAVTRGYLWSSDRQRDAAWNMAAGATLLALAAYPLAVKYGANGVAGGLVCAEGLLLALNLVSTRVNSLAWKLWPHVVGASGAISAGYALYIFTENGVSLWLVGAVCAAVHVAMTLATGGLKKRELSAIWGSFKP